MRCRSLECKGSPGARLLKRVDAGAKLVLQAGHEVACGRDDLVRVHVGSSWRDSSECAHLVRVEVSDRRTVSGVQVRKHLVPQVDQFTRPERGEIASQELKKPEDALAVRGLGGRRRRGPWRGSYRSLAGGLQGHGSSTRNGKQPFYSF
jgi:hypothetical protein